jgi:hypothetical protein
VHAGQNQVDADRAGCTFNNLVEVKEAIQRCWEEEEK